MSPMRFSIKRFSKVVLTISFRRITLWALHQRNVVVYILNVSFTSSSKASNGPNDSVLFEGTYFAYFSNFQKNMTFTFFFRVAAHIFSNTAYRQCVVVTCYTSNRSHVLRTRAYVLRMFLSFSNVNSLSPRLLRPSTDILETFPHDVRWKNRLLIKTLKPTRYTAIGGLCVCVFEHNFWTKWQLSQSESAVFGRTFFKVPSKTGPKMAFLWKQVYNVSDNACQTSASYHLTQIIWPRYFAMLVHFDTIWVKLEAHGSTIIWKLHHQPYANLPLSIHSP